MVGVLILSLVIGLAMCIYFWIRRSRRLKKEAKDEIEKRKLLLSGRHKNNVAYADHIISEFNRISKFPELKDSEDLKKLESDIQTLKKTIKRDRIVPEKMPEMDIFEVEISAENKWMVSGFQNLLNYATSITEAVEQYGKDLIKLKNASNEIDESSKDYATLVSRNDFTQYKTDMDDSRFDEVMQHMKNSIERAEGFKTFEKRILLHRQLDIYSNYWALYSSLIYEKNNEIIKNESAAAKVLGFESRVNIISSSINARALHADVNPDTRVNIQESIHNFVYRDLVVPSISGMPLPEIYRMLGLQDERLDKMNILANPAEREISEAEKVRDDANRKKRILDNERKSSRSSGYGSSYSAGYLSGSSSSDSWSPSSSSSSSNYGSGSSSSDFGGFGGGDSGGGGSSGDW